MRVCVGLSVSVSVSVVGCRVVSTVWGNYGTSESFIKGGAPEFGADAVEVRKPDASLVPNS